MTEYEACITLGNPYDPFGTVTIETQHRDLLDLLHKVVEESYNIWYKKADDE